MNEKEIMDMVHRTKQLKEEVLERIQEREKSPVERFFWFKTEVVGNRYDNALNYISNQPDLVKHKSVRHLVGRAVSFELGELLCRSKVVDRNVEIKIPADLAKLSDKVGLRRESKEKEGMYRKAKHFLLGQGIGDHRDWEDAYEVFSEVFGSRMAVEILEETAKELGIYALTEPIDMLPDGQPVSKIDMMRSDDEQFYLLVQDVKQFVDTLDERRRTDEITKGVEPVQEKEQNGIEKER